MIVDIWSSPNPLIRIGDERHINCRYIESVDNRTKNMKIRMNSGIVYIVEPHFVENVIKGLGLDLTQRT